MIYFLQIPTGGLIKIGTTSQLSVRLKQLTAKHGPLDILAVLDGGLDVEQELHERFAPNRLEGEWFEPSDILLNFIASEGKPWDGVDEREPIRHARIELPNYEYRRLKKAASRFHMGVAGYIRQAVMERIARDEQKMIR